MEYLCPNCGQVHNNWPAIAFAAPNNYYQLPDDERLLYVKEKNDDFCVIEYDNQTDYFIRAVLFQEVIDSCQDLHYGVWVSLSEKSFNDYNNNFRAEDHDDTYFGYLCTHFPEYKDMGSIKANVVLSKGKHRPEIIPHQDQMNNEFVKDYYNGITKAEAEKRIRALLG